MENKPFSSHTIIEPISEVRTDKQSDNLCLQDPSLRERERCISDGFALITPSLPVRYSDDYGVKHYESHRFLIDTGATMICLPQPLNPLKNPDMFMLVETGSAQVEQSDSETAGSCRDTNLPDKIRKISGRNTASMFQRFAVLSCRIR
jgi:hypothetical protein